MISICEDGHGQVAYDGDVCPACAVRVDLADADQEASAALARVDELLFENEQLRASIETLEAKLL